MICLVGCLQGDFEKAAAYYRASIQDLKNPRDFILPYYGKKR